MCWGVVGVTDALVGWSALTDSLGRGAGLTDALVGRTALTDALGRGAGLTDALVPVIGCFGSPTHQFREPGSPTHQFREPGPPTHPFRKPGQPPISCWKPVPPPIPYHGRSANRGGGLLPAAPYPTPPQPPLWPLGRSVSPHHA